eukprot:685454-Amphidinium_carterae.1
MRASFACGLLRPHLAQLAGRHSCWPMRLVLVDRKNTPKNRTSQHISSSMTSEERGYKLHSLTFKSSTPRLSQFQKKVTTECI